MESIKQDAANSKLTQDTIIPKEICTEDEKDHENQFMPAEKKPREEIPDVPIVQEAALKDDIIQNVDVAQTVTAYNPTIPDEDEDTEILESMRGDAIGNTLYSARFVINTLLKLRDIKEPLENDENFEKDLESLWDMTVEKDVVLMLLQFDVFEVFMQCLLKYPTDGRLIEILVGIMGNMCSVAEEALEKLCITEAAIDVLIQLISTDDSGVLIQLMRLFAIAFTKESSAHIWIKHMIKSSDFVDCFCFILNNSCNTSLLLHSLETLNAILAKSAIIPDETANGVQTAIGDEKQEKENINYLRYFLNLKLSESIKQAFLTFHAKETVYTGRCDNSDDDDNVDEDFNESISESVQKAFIIFLNIEEIIFNYAFDDIFIVTSETELKSCLLVIVSTISTPIFVLPNNFNYLLNVLEIFKEFFQANSSLHDETMASYVANMFEILRKLKLKQANGAANNGFDDENDDLLDEGVNESLNKLFKLTQALLKIMLQKYDADILEVILRRLSPLAAFKLLEAFGVPLSPDYIEELHINTLHCEQLKIALSA